MEGERNLSEKPLWAIRHEIFIDAAAGSDTDYCGWAGNLNIAVWRSQSSRQPHKLKNARAELAIAPTLGVRREMLTDVVASLTLITAGGRVIII